MLNVNTSPQLPRAGVKRDLFPPVLRQEQLPKDMQDPEDKCQKREPFHRFLDGFEIFRSWSMERHLRLSHCT
jgi:hypothetical protein